jgi:glutamate-1-semialdehyde 2,1-aminomutase
MKSHSHSSELYESARRYMPGGVNSPVRAFKAVGGGPFFVQRAEGSRFWDIDGNEYIDYVGSWGPAILGHAPRAIVDAVKATSEKGVSFGIPSPLEVEMAQLICEWIPSIEKVRMVNSGTEATMSCIRLARGVTGRDKIVKFAGCYHGHVDSLLVKSGSGVLTHGVPDSAGVPQALASLTATLPFNDPDAVREVFQRDGNTIAAVILEPIPANAGLFIPRAGFLQLLRELCSKHGTLLIFDEVMTGFRVARGGAQEIYNVTPDLTALGKVIGGGLPVGAFGGRAELMDNLAPEGPVYQAGTLSGNPLAMAAGLAQLRELERENAWAKLELSGALLEDLLSPALRNQRLVRIGSMFCLFFIRDEVTNLETAQRCNREAFARFFHHCLDAGVYLPPSQFETAFISLAHSETDLRRSAEVMANALELLERRPPS